MQQFKIRFSNLRLTEDLTSDEVDRLTKLVFNRLQHVIEKMLVVDDKGQTVVYVNPDKVSEFLSCAYSYKDWEIENRLNRTID